MLVLILILISEVLNPDFVFGFSFDVSLFICDGRSVVVVRVLFCFWSC